MHGNVRLARVEDDVPRRGDRGSGDREGVVTGVGVGAGVGTAMVAGARVEAATRVGVGTVAVGAGTPQACEPRTAAATTTARVVRSKRSRIARVLPAGAVLPVGRARPPGCAARRSLLHVQLGVQELAGLEVEDDELGAGDRRAA
jgi:hypothetical protein